MQKKHSGPQIVAKFRQADILIGQGKMVPQVCKELEISQHTYYRRQRVRLMIILLFHIVSVRNGFLFFIKESPFLMRKWAIQ